MFKNFFVAKNSERMTLLAFLDLNEAFDTVNYDVLGYCSFASAHTHSYMYTYIHVILYTYA